MKLNLVTGGTGLVGSHVLYYLCLQNSTVRAIKRAHSNTDSVKKIFQYLSPNGIELFSKIEWIEADLLDIPSLEIAFENVNFVYHCAAFVSFKSGDKKLMKQINETGTANVVNLSLDFNIEKFCHVSSIAALGRNSKINIVDESHWWKPSKENSSYSESKFGAEREVWRGIEEGLNAVIINPSIIIGPGEWGKSSTNFFPSAFKGLKFYADGKSGFVDVRDVAQIMIQLMNNEFSGERFIVNGENLRYRHFFNLLHQALGKPIPSIHISKSMSEIIWRLSVFAAWLTRTNPLITKETAQSAYQEFEFSNQKIATALNINFIKIEDAIKHTANIFLADRKK